MDMDDSSMGGMSMGMGGPSMYELQKIYWAFIGSAIGVAAVVNIINRSVAARRMVGKGDGFLYSNYTTAAAITRELAYASVSLPLLGKSLLSSVTLGKVILVLSNLVLVLVLCFYNLNTRDQWQWETVGYQTGFITAAQLPLVILLAGKRNIIGYLIGSSYERLSWLHRWVSRTVFLTATIHMGFWFRSWARYDYIGQKLSSDVISRRGLAAWCILFWIVFSSFAPIRRWNYEFFVVQHVLTLIGFLAAVFLHLPAQVKAWIWIPIGLYILDRALRSFLIVYDNCGLLSKSKRGILTCQAKVEYAGAGLSRVTIREPSRSWSPGQHVFLQCHGIAPLQSHPFTIASLPEDRQMEFLVKSRSGATKRFLTHAQKGIQLPGVDSKSHAAVIDGPYGCMRTLRQFDSVFLIAGGCGATFTTPLMRDIVSSWKQQRPLSILKQFFRAQGSATRLVRFIWVVKSREELAWFSSQMNQAVKDTQDLQHDRPDIALDISIYVTCDAECPQQSMGGIELNSLVKEVSSSDVSRKSTEQMKADLVSVKSQSSTPSERSDLLKKGCGKDGTCCCAKVIANEDQASQSSKLGEKTICHCNEKAASSGSLSGSTRKSELIGVDSALLNSSTKKPPYRILTGRPDSKNLIRAMLERARGESAVVVCGPTGLNDSVRQNVVALSDERAVGRSTGAHGIYFWEEGFSY